MCGKIAISFNYHIYFKNIYCLIISAAVINKVRPNGSNLFNALKSVECQQIKRIKISAVN